MAESTVCNICISEYHHINCIPKCLPCGHTFCSSCISKCLENNRLCPNCQHPVSATETSFPVNYALLSLVDTFKSSNISDSNFLRSLLHIKYSYLTRKNFLSKKKEEILPFLKIIDKGLENLEALEASHKLEMDPEDRIKVLRELKEEFKRTESVTFCSYSQLKLSVTIPFEDSEGPEEYLNKIYNLLQEDEKIYSVYKIKDKVKYGKLSLFDNKILFHSLSLDEFPASSSLIWFEDLKKCSGCRDMFPFIKIRCNDKNLNRLVYFQMYDNVSANLFTKLCTGECGPSYKGVSYFKGPTSHCLETVLQINVDNFLEALTITDYVISVEQGKVIFNFLRGQIYLLVNNYGNFAMILTHDYGQFGNVPSGVVVYPPLLKCSINYNHSSNLQIIDCGISFKVI